MHMNFIKITLNNIQSYRKINKNKDYVYYLQVLGLSWMPTLGKFHPVIYRIENIDFKHIRYDFATPSEEPLKIHFSEKQSLTFRRKTSIKHEIKRTIKYLNNYVVKHSLGKLVYPEGHPLTVLTPIMLSVGDQPEIIRNVLQNKIHPYTLALLVAQKYTLKDIEEITGSLTDEYVNKIYL